MYIYISFICYSPSIKGTAKRYYRVSNDHDKLCLAKYAPTKYDHHKDEIPCSRY